MRVKMAKKNIDRKKKNILNQGSSVLDPTKEMLFRNSCEIEVSGYRANKRIQMKQKNCELENIDSNATIDFINIDNDAIAATILYYIVLYGIDITIDCTGVAQKKYTRVLKRCCQVS